MADAEAERNVLGKVVNKLQGWPCLATLGCTIGPRPQEGLTAGDRYHGSSSAESQLGEYVKEYM